jgi:rhamnogalacturonan hydrolase
MHSSSSFLSFLAITVALPALVVGRLSGKVGPTTSHATKAAKKTCDITKYGALADGKTDISTALNSAFAACKLGGVVVIPTGNFAMSTWVNLAGGENWALQLDGLITRTGTAGGNMIMIQNSQKYVFLPSSMVEKTFSC